ncbi:hypothetical protein EVAR_39332_1 [Eumeta japonica]|uniref:Uncharacterized protein n=1 Tax=Eumeta variegata TaxID=151549 RepID=A0A4C1WRP5_EUMVA|nr:hypothetical protein EVAR_39332_1 [Eumeta japonica]
MESGPQDLSLTERNATAEAATLRLVLNYKDNRSVARRDERLAGARGCSGAPAAEYKSRLSARCEISAG